MTLKTQTLMGIPRNLPTGLDKVGYVKMMATSKAAAPRWVEDDLFKV
jgi:hydrogenase small subunit